MAPITGREVIYSVLLRRDPMTNPAVPFPMILLCVGVILIGASCGLIQQFGCCEQNANDD